jgi:hypothetical protein
MPPPEDGATPGPSNPGIASSSPNASEDVTDQGSCAGGLIATSKPVAMRPRYANEERHLGLLMEAKQRPRPASGTGGAAVTARPFAELFGGRPGDGSPATLARSAARAGYAVLPIAPGEKRPLCVLTERQRQQADKAAASAARDAGKRNWERVRHECGIKHSTTDETEAHRWFKRLADEHPGLNLAVDVYRSRALVVDSDTAEELASFNTLWARMEGVEDLIHAAPTVRSPGARDENGVWKHSDGGHSWFLLPDGVDLGDLTDADTIPIGADEEHLAQLKVRGYVLVPPSVRPEGEYRMASDAHIAPDWLVKLVVEHIAGRREKRLERQERALAAPRGGGDRIQMAQSAISWASILVPRDWVDSGKATRCGCPEWTAPGDHASTKSATAHDSGCAEFDTADGFIHIWTDNPPGELSAASAKTFSKIQFVAWHDYGGAMGAAMAELGIERAPEPAAAPTEAAETAGEPTLPALLEQLRTWQDLPDPVYVVAALAVAVVAAETDGEPAWLLIVAPPSSGKTEAVNLLRGITAGHLDDVSIGGLLTWSKGKAPKPTGLLSRVTNGLVTFGDLSALLSNSDRGSRDAVFALLRRVYDGNVDRTIASPTGAQLTWSGRITAVGAVTAAIDDYSTHNSMLGDRWIYVRPPARTTTAARRAAKMARHGGLTAARTAGARHAHAVVQAARGRLGGVEVSETLADAIEDAAMVLRWGRAAVKRHGYGAREIDGLPQIEEPPRIIRQLTAVAHGLLALGLDDVQTADVCRRLALDSMPAARAAVLDVLAEAADELSTSEVARRAGVDRSVARRNLEELDAIGVVRVHRVGAEPEEEGPDKRPAGWRLADEDGDLIRDVFGLVSMAPAVFGVEPEELR